MQTSSGPRPRKLKSAVNEDNLERAKMVPLSEVKLKGSWKKYDSEEGLISGWILEKMPDMMVAQKAGDSIEFKFEGTMAGFYDIMGPAVGVIECDIDGKKIYASRFDKYCTYYRIGSRTYDTPQGEHKVSFTLTDRDIDKAAVLSERGSSIDDPARYSGKNWYVGKIMLIGDLITE
jgi:hypothetical protein